MNTSDTCGVVSPQVWTSKYSPAIPFSCIHYVYSNMGVSADTEEEARAQTKPPSSFCNAFLFLNLGTAPTPGSVCGRETQVLQQRWTVSMNCRSLMHY